MSVHVIICMGDCECVRSENIYEGEVIQRNCQVGFFLSWFLMKMNIRQEEKLEDMRSNQEKLKIKGKNMKRR